MLQQAVMAHVRIPHMAESRRTCCKASVPQAIAVGATRAGDSDAENELARLNKALDSAEKQLEAAQEGLALAQQNQRAAQQNRDGAQEILRRRRTAAEDARNRWKVAREISKLARRVLAAAEAAGAGLTTAQKKVEATNAEEDEQARADLAGGAALDADGGAADALDDRAHATCRSRRQSRLRRCR